MPTIQRKKSPPTSAPCPKAPHSLRCLTVLVLMLLLFGSNAAFAQAPVQSPASAWRSATDTELQALIPARATVEKEHIETEMRSASGVTNGHGSFFAGVVLITAGYSADGKYSHYLIAQVPIQIGDISLPAGEYVFGWKRGDDVLNMDFYDAITGAQRGRAQATRIAGSTRVEAFKIWPPRTRAILQIGRFGIPYRLLK